MRTCALLACLLVGCGLAPPDLTGLDPCPTMHFAEVWGTPLTCAAAPTLEEDAQRFFLAAVGTSTEWQTLAPSYTLVIHPGDNFDGPYGLASGFTGPECIQVGRGGPALLHELLHAVELHRGVLNTSAHPGWEAKGYYALDDLFSAQRNRVDVGACHRPQLLPAQLQGLLEAGVDVERLDARLRKLTECP